MRSRVLVGALLALPAAAFAAGALTGIDVDVPAERTPIVIQDAEASTAPRTDRAAGERAARPTRTASPSPRRSSGTDRGVPGDDRVEVVNPRPDDIGTADDDAGRDDDPGDDAEGDDDEGDDAGEDDDAGDDD